MLTLRCEDCGHDYEAPVVSGEHVVSVETLSIVRGTESRAVPICPTCADKL